METLQKPVRVTVNILGDRYVIRGDADPDYIAEIARLVDDKMRHLREATKESSRSRLAVLTAINLADELLQERRSGKESGVDGDIARRAQDLITMLDEGLSGDSFADELTGPH